MHELMPEDVAAHAWLGGRRRMVGWGQALTLTVSGRHAIRDAARAWDRLRQEAIVTSLCDDATLPSFPVAFASFGFAAETPGFVFLPEVTVVEIPAP